MDKNLIMETFRKAIEEKKTEIEDLQLQYITLKAMDETVKYMFEESAKAVLEANTFYAELDRAAMWNKRCKGEFDGRCRTETEAFLMSEADYEKFLHLWTTENVRRGLVNADGTYTEETNTSQKLTHLKDYIIHYAVELLPEMEDKDILRKAVTHGDGYSYKTWEAIFDLFMKLSTAV